jgi:hypothetical protein
LARFQEAVIDMLVQAEGEEWWTVAFGSFCILSLNKHFPNTGKVSHSCSEQPEMS